MADNWKRLGLCVFRRRVDLGFSSRRALADAAGIGKRTMDTIEKGGPVRSITLYKIETALKWTPGSATSVLAGEEPQLVEGHNAAPVDPEDTEFRMAVRSYLANHPATAAAAILRDEVHQQGGDPFLAQNVN